MHRKNQQRLANVFHRKQTNPGTWRSNSSIEAIFIMQFILPLAYQCAGHNNEYSEVLVFTCQNAENRACFDSLTQTNFISQHIPDRRGFKATSHCTYLVWKQKSTATSEHAETIGSIVHKVKVFTHFEMVDEPCGVLKLISSELLVRSKVHLRIIKLEPCFTLFDMLSVWKFDPIPVRLVLRIGGRSAGHDCTSAPTSFNHAPRAGFTTSHCLGEKHIVLKYVPIVLPAAQ